MSWYSVGSLNEFTDGEMRTVEVAGVRVLLVGRGEGVAAIPPMCPHLEEPLEHGMCDGRLLTCMKHLWQWELDDGSPVGLAEAPLKMYPTRVVDGQVEVLVEQELIYERTS